MADVVEYYLTEMADKFHYYAAWLPGISLRLGDIGIINDQNQFIPKTSLKSRGIAFEVREDAKKNDLKHTSAEGVSISMKAAGDVMAGTKVLKPADIGFIAEFGRENAVVFQADGVVSTRIEDIDRLTADIAAKAEKNEWKKEWVVITELIAADSSTILISNSNNARVEIKANADVPGLNIASADARLGVAFESGMHTSLVAKNGLTPLFNVAKLESSGTGIFGGIITIGHGNTRGMRSPGKGPAAPTPPVRKPAQKRPAGSVLGKGKGKAGEYSLVKVPFKRKKGI
jgi:hypothetical protein